MQVMNDHDESTTVDSQHSEDGRQGLVQLLEKVLECGGDESEKREEIAAYCRTAEIEKSMSRFHTSHDNGLERR